MLKKSLFACLIIYILTVLIGCQSTQVKGVSSTPTLSEGTLYFGSVDKNVYGVNASDGKQTVKFENMGIVGTAPAVSDGKLFVGNDDQILYAMDINSKKLLWSYEAGGQVVSSTYYNEGIVYFATDNFYAIDAQTGKELWRFELDTAASTPVVADNTVYFLGYNSNAYAFDSKTGKQKWEVAIDDNAFTELSPVVADGIVYVAADDLLALDAKTGKEIWRFAVDGEVLSELNKVDDIIYFGTDKDKIYGVDVKSKKEVVSFSSGEEVFSSPAADNGKLYFGSNEGNFYSFDAQTGKQEWKVKLASVDKNFFQKMIERTAEQRPIIKDGILYYVMVNDGTLFAIDSQNGKTKWKI